MLSLLVTVIKILGPRKILDLVILLLEILAKNTDSHVDDEIVKVVKRVQFKHGTDDSDDLGF